MKTNLLKKQTENIENVKIKIRKECGRLLLNFFLNIFLIK